MIEPHSSANFPFYELGKIVLAFVCIGIGTLIFVRLILRSGKRGLNKRHLESNRQQRRAERARTKRKRLQ